MKPYILIPSVLFIVFAITGGILLLREKNPTKDEDQEFSLATQTNQEGDVTVSVTPPSVLKNTTQWEFKIILDTHTEALDVDVMETTLLIDEKGNIYKPIDWQGTPPGGHHREGILTFNAISPLPKSIQLVIKRVGGVAERNFLWTIP